MAIIGEFLPLYISYISDYGTAPAQVLANNGTGVGGECSITEDLLPVLEADNCVFRYWEFNGVRVQAGDVITVTDDMKTADSSSYVITLTAAWLVYEDETSGSYKPRVKNNNTDLQSILDRVNALPDAGASAVSVTLNANYYANIYYFTEEGNGESTNSAKTVRALGGIVLAMNGGASIKNATGDYDYVNTDFGRLYCFHSDGGMLEYVSSEPD